MNSTINSYSLLDQSDTQHATLKILQASSQPVAEGKSEPGKIYNSLTEDSYEKLDLVFLGVRKEFRIWNGQERLSKYPEYVSNDMKTLIRLNPQTGEKIGEEPLWENENWLNRKENKNAKTQYCFLAAIPTEPQPVLFRVVGLGVRHARRFLNQASNSGRQIFEFVTNVSVKQENTNYGSKFVPNFQIGDTPVPEEWRKKSADLCRKFMEETRHPLPAPSPGKA